MQSRSDFQEGLVGLSSRVRQQGRHRERSQGLRVAFFAAGHCVARAP
jgi:hypothetical protein